MGATYTGKLAHSPSPPSPLPPSLGVVLPVNWLISVPQVTQAIREGAVKRSKEELDNLQVNADWNRMMVREVRPHSLGGHSHYLHRL